MALAETPGVHAGDDDEVAARDSGEVPAPASSVGRASLWSLFAYAVTRASAFVLTIVIARSVAPGEWGVFASALTVLAIADVVNEFGLGEAIIRSPDRSERLADIAFGLSLLIGAAFSVLGIVTAPLVADFFGEPALSSVLMVLSATYLISSLWQIHQGVLARNLEFGRRAVPEVGQALGKLIITATLAAAGLGVWSLVWGHLAGNALASLLYWMVTPWRARPRFDRKASVPLLGYGRHVAALGLLAIVVDSIDYVLVGRRLGLESLGIYQMAFRLPEMTVLGIPYVIGRTLLPAFAALQHDAAGLKESVLRSLRTTAAIIVPMGVGISLVADHAVQVLFGYEWSAVSPVLVLLGVTAAVRGSYFHIGLGCRAIGKVHLVTAIELPSTVVFLALVWWASSRSLIAVATAHFLVSLMRFVLNGELARRLLGINPGDLIAAFFPVLCGAVCMVAAVLIVDLVGPTGLGDVASLAAGVMVAVPAYLVGVTLADVGWVRGVVRRTEPLF